MADYSACALKATVSLSQAKSVACNCIALSLRKWFSVICFNPFVDLIASCAVFPYRKIQLLLCLSQKGALVPRPPVVLVPGLQLHGPGLLRQPLDSLYLKIFLYPLAARQLQLFLNPTICWPSFGQSSSDFLRVSAARPPLM